MPIRKMLRVLGRPMPVMVVPNTEEEALYGKATLLTPGEISTLITVLKRSRTYRDDRLIEKLELLADT